MYNYDGNITPEFLSEALEALETYRSDREVYLQRLRDDEDLYKRSYNRTQQQINRRIDSSTNFIFSSIENAVATANENYPEPNILPRSKHGEEAAQKLSQIVPVILDQCAFKKCYKINMRKKAKLGTAIYFISADENEQSVHINSLNFTDVYIDSHVSDVQDSKFLFIESAVDNDKLRKDFPELADLFTGSAKVTTLDSQNTFDLKNASIILDCYYKKDGKLHMVKLINNEIIVATEDLPGYENGLYEHGLFPVVFDRQFPIDESPYGFGFIDVAKSTQIFIDKLDTAIVDNIMANAKPRYFTKKNSGIDEDAFKDMSRNTVPVEGDIETNVKAIQGVLINGNYLTHRDTKKDELKELLYNRDFQQGETSSGVQAASAILALQQAGEKRARLMSDDSYDAFKDILYQVIELVRQFYTSSHSFRIINENGRSEFVDFDNRALFDGDEPSMFDIDVVPQKENPYSREMFNQTILSLWNAGMLNPTNYAAANVAIRNMQFDGKEHLLSDLEDAHEKYEKQQQEAAQAQQPAQAPASAAALPDPSGGGMPQLAGDTDFVGIPVG